MCCENHAVERAKQLLFHKQPFKCLCESEKKANEEKNKLPRKIEEISTSLSLSLSLQFHFIPTITLFHLAINKSLFSRFFCIVSPQKWRGKLFPQDKKRKRERVAKAE